MIIDLTQVRHGLLGVPGKQVCEGGPDLVGDHGQTDGGDGQSQSCLPSRPCLALGGAKRCLHKVCKALKIPRC